MSPVRGTRDNILLPGASLSLQIYPFRIGIGRLYHQRYDVDGPVNGWQFADILDLITNRNCSHPLRAVPLISKGRYDSDWGKNEPRTLINLGEAELPIGDCSLLFHNVRLARIDPILQTAYANQNNGEEYLYPVREFEVPKTFRQAPLALIWLCGCLAAWFFCAWHAHKVKSPLWPVIAMVFLLISVTEASLIVLWEMDF